MQENCPSPKDDAVLEYRPGVEQAIRIFAAHAEKAPLAVLVIDYGYSKPSYGDTVQAVSRHLFTGVFDAPGEADLTAHLDFCHLKTVAEDLGFLASGPMPMGDWLLRLGLEARFHQLVAGASEEDAREMVSRISRLVDPTQMGVLFKVMALTRGFSGTPAPFRNALSDGKIPDAG